MTFETIDAVLLGTFAKVEASEVWLVPFRYHSMLKLVVALSASDTVTVQERFVEGVGV